MRAIVPALLVLSLGAQDIGPTAIGRQPPPPPDMDVVDTVAGMARNPTASAAFRAHGLDLLSLTWEDTARWKQSSWGPNISDLTIQVLGARHGSDGCMPVARYPNFADKTCDVPIGSLKLLIGNERGQALERIDLRQYLQRFAEYQSAPTGHLRGQLLGDRDAVILASAQACFLPVASGATTTFAPVLFNYQSRPDAPAVLAIVATPEGTSAQVITNSGEAASGVWHGQRLFHNRAGERAPLTAMRFADHERHDGGGLDDAGGNRDGMSMVLVIQVPLKQPRLMRGQPSASADMEYDAKSPLVRSAGASGVDTAVIASGSVEGPWLGLAGHTIERDWDFPIRATVQFYQATDTATVTSADVARVTRAIERCYLDANAVGSLVVDGMTGRPTEHAAGWPQPWWRGPCEKYTATTNEPWQAALGRVRARLGDDWQPADARELSNALALVRP